MPKADWLLSSRGQQSILGDAEGLVASSGREKLVVVQHFGDA
jgi:hypothetical protein